MLDYRLHVFRTVAELKSISAAARKLNISQPAVTQHIKRLEEEFSSQLILRSPSGISLTETGYVLLDHALRVADLHEEVAQKLGVFQGRLSGQLRLGASTTITQYYLPPLLAAFLRAHPDVHLSFLGGNTEEIIGALLSHRIDLGLVEGLCRRRDLKAKDFYEDEIVCVAAKGHPATRTKTLIAGALADYPIIQREAGSGTREYAERALRRAGVKVERLRVVAEVPSSEAIKGILEAGLGLSFLSRLSVREELESGDLCEVKIRGVRIQRPFLALHHQGPAPGGVAGAFLKTVL
jgi:LysR family transcriptional regulator, transcriptional activator of the cysJI operon